MKNSIVKKGALIALGLTAFGLVTTQTSPFQAVENQAIFIERASAGTASCLSVYSQLSAESVNTGGNYGLVNDSTSLSTAWSRLSAASDASVSGTKITDGSSNIYVKYNESSRATFSGKGYTTVGTISLSSGPDSVKKIRFTKP